MSKKYTPANIKALRLLKRLRCQLKAMNCSPAHACSWIEPVTKTTARRVKECDRVIVALAEEMSP